MNSMRFLITSIIRQRAWVVILLSFVLGVSSCSRRQLPVSSPPVTDLQLQAFISSGTGKRLNTGGIRPKQVIRTAGKFMGTPHCMGGTTARCMDCSGLIYTSFASCKIVLPRSSQDQARYGRIISDRNALKRGDLVFFTKSYNTSDYITHVGIYLGNNRFIHTSTSSGVLVTPLDNSWWSQRFVFGTRVF
jgi:cell wall-associated NlpC family hydrolase